MYVESFSLIAFLRGRPIRIFVHECHFLRTLGIVVCMPSHRSIGRAPLGHSAVPYRRTASSSQDSLQWISVFRIPGANEACLCASLAITTQRKPSTSTSLTGFPYKQTARPRSGFAFPRVLPVHCTALHALLDRPKPPPAVTEEQVAIAQAVIVTDDVSWTLDSGPTTAPPPAPPEDAFSDATSRAESRVRAPPREPEAGRSSGGGGGGGGGGSWEEGTCSSTPDPPTPLGRRPLRLVGGVDISFVKGSHENACASLVVLEFPSLETVYETYERVTMGYPYISGFLAFREVGVLIRFEWKQGTGLVNKGGVGVGTLMRSGLDT